MEPLRIHFVVCWGQFRPSKIIGGGGGGGGDMFITPDQNKGGALLKFSMRTAMQHLFGIINKISPPCSPSAIVAQCERRWTTDLRVMQLVGTSPPGDVFQIRFSNYFYLSFYCCEHNLTCVDEPFFLRIGLFSGKSSNNSVNCPACLICSSKFSLARPTMSMC